MLNPVTIGFFIALIPVLAVIPAVGCIALFHHIRGY